MPKTYRKVLSEFLPEMPPNKMTEYWAGIFRAVVSDP